MSFLETVSEYLTNETFAWVHLAVTVVLFIILIWMCVKESFDVDHQSAPLAGQRVDSTGVGGLLRYNEFTGTNQGWSNPAGRSAQYMQAGMKEGMAANNAEAPVFYDVSRTLDAYDYSEAKKQAGKGKLLTKENFQVGGRFVAAPEQFSVEDKLRQTLHGQ